MSAITDPALGLYGTWEAANKECVDKGVEFSSNTRMIVLLFASVCFCQTVYMTSRAPRVNWEGCYLPLCETFLYGLSASGNGMIRLSNGRMVPMARFCSWLVTCPIMLMSVLAIHDVRWMGVPVKNMVIAATLIRTVLGIGASSTTTETLRWVQYCIACVVFVFELTMVNQLFIAGLQKFGVVKTKLNDMVYMRILILRALFFFSWTAFPVIWILSSTGFCIIGEDGSVLAYLVADFLCKNVYGIINTNTLFQVLDGEWKPETRDTDGKIATNRHAHIGETYLEMLLARMRRHREGELHYEEDEQPDDSVDEQRDVATATLQDVRVERTDDGVSRAPSKEAAQQYSERLDRLRNRNPEAFVPDTLPDLGLAPRSAPHPSDLTSPTNASRAATVSRRRSQELILSQSPLERAREAAAPSSPVMASAPRRLLSSDSLPGSAGGDERRRSRGRGMTRGDAETLDAFLELARGLAAAGEELRQARGRGRSREDEMVELRESAGRRASGVREVRSASREPRPQSLRDIEYDDMHGQA